MSESINENPHLAALAALGIRKRDDAPASTVQTELEAEATVYFDQVEDWLRSMKVSGFKIENSVVELVLLFRNLVAGHGSLIYNAVFPRVFFSGDEDIEQTGKLEIHIDAETYAGIITLNAREVSLSQRNPDAFKDLIKSTVFAICEGIYQIKLK